MWSFIGAIVLLIVGYVVYGKFIERFFGADPKRKTPVQEFADGVANTIHKDLVVESVNITSGEETEPIGVDINGGIEEGGVYLYYDSDFDGLNDGIEIENWFDPLEDDYDKIKKVYSIWICMNAPSYAENTITEYGIQKRSIAGEFPENKGRYDLMSVIMICLSKKVAQAGDNTKLQRLLGTLLASEMTKAEKKDIIESEYGIPMKQEIERRVNTMCNLSEAIEKRGIEQGIERGIERGEDKMARLIAILSKEQDFTMITKVSTDVELRKKLYKQYGIE